jgi:predicted nucleic acid-binding protein
MMRVLLDTNILIHRESSVVVRESIGLLFNWLDRLKYNKCIHPLSRDEIGKHQDARVRAAFAAKLASYGLLKTLAPVATETQALLAKDATENDRNDTLLLNEVHAGRVDYIISEDKGVARKAEALGIGDRAFTIDSFLEKVNAEHPALVDYKVLSLKKKLFGELSVAAPFFDSFRTDYAGAAFDAWFNRKSDEPAYVCLSGTDVLAFLYLKVEGPDENYFDIQPTFAPARRMKIGTLKAELNGYRLGERFLQVIFDNALRQKVHEIYVTSFDRTVEQNSLIHLLEQFGFVRHGVKHNDYGDELVCVRNFRPQFSPAEPKKTYPFVSRSSRHFLVPIYPDYHTSLLPDSILRTEKPEDFDDPEPHRYGISKVYISRSIYRELQPGDVIVFYRTGGYYQGVATTLAVVDTIRTDIADEDQFVRLCRKRSVFSDEELRKHWRYNPSSRPFIVGFLPCCSFPKRPNLKELIDNGIVKDIDSAPRGFERISTAQFERIIELSKTDPRLVVD